MEDFDLSQLAPDQVRDRPRLPHPAWALLFVALAVADLWLAFGCLRLIGPNGLTQCLMLRIEMDVAWGMALGIALVGVWLWAARNPTAGALPFVLRRPGLHAVGWLGVLFIGALYAATFLPVVFLGPEGPAGRALAAVPLDVAMAYLMSDLRRYHREAWRIIRQVKGQAPAAAPEGGEALLRSPEVAALTPDDLLDAPRWYYNLPALLGVVQAALFLVGLAEVASAWAVQEARWWGAPWEVWAFGLWGIAIGLWGTWHEVRQLRRPGRTLELALRAVLKERRRFPFYLWDWWGYTVILAALAAALIAIFPLAEPQMRLAGGSLSLGYGIGVTPLYPHYARPWRLPGEILKEVRSEG